MRPILSLIALAVLAACVATPPDDVAPIKTMPISDETIALAPEEQPEAGLPDQTGDSAPVVITADNPEISDTQDFGAVTERLTIEDDKAVLEAQREKFKVIEPTALPTRNGKSANVVEYALNSKNRVGEKLYSRLNPLGGAIAKRNCARYRLPDDAQAAFLEAGGPRRDSKNLDPDGDGFACDWTPETYRKLIN